MLSESPRFCNNFAMLQVMLRVQAAGVASLEALPPAYLLNDDARDSTGHAGAAEFRRNDAAAVGLVMMLQLHSALCARASLHSVHV